MQLARLVLPVDIALQENSRILYTRLLRYCKYCEKETSHEVRSGPDGKSEVCIRCREDQLLAELDED